MTRFASIAVLAVVMAACADSATAPATRPSGPSFDVGNPPPPRVNGGGAGTLSVTPDASSASIQGAASPNTPGDPCSPHTQPVTYSSEFFQNKPNTNAWLRLQLDLGGNVTIRRHGLPVGATLNAQGTIDGLLPTPFSFQITDVIQVVGEGAGFLEGGGEGGRASGNFFVTVRGIIMEANGATCPGGGTFEGFFSSAG